MMMMMIIMVMMKMVMIIIVIMVVTVSSPTAQNDKIGDEVNIFVYELLFKHYICENIPDVKLPRSIITFPLILIGVFVPGETSDVCGQGNGERFTLISIDQQSN